MPQKLAAACISLFFLCLASFACADDGVIALVGGFSKTNSANLNLIVGVRRAMREVNAQGPLLGRKLQLETFDDEASPDKAAMIAQRLAAARPSLIVGDTSSATVLRSAPIYGAAAIVQITPVATNPQVTEQGITTLFRTIGRDDHQGETDAQFLIAHFRDREIAIVSDGSVYGESLTQLVADRLHRAKILEIGRIKTEGAVAALSKLKPEVIFAAISWPADAAQFVRVIREAGIKATIIGTDGFSDTIFHEITGTLGDGVIFTAAHDPRDNPANKAVIDDLRSAGAEPVIPVFMAYAAVQVWAQAVRKAGSYDGKAVAKALHEGEFQTVLGKTSFDQKGDLIGDAGGFDLYVWQGNSYRHWRP